MQFLHFTRVIFSFVEQAPQVTFKHILQYDAEQLRQLDCWHFRRLARGGRSTICDGEGDSSLEFISPWSSEIKFRMNSRRVRFFPEIFLNTIHALMAAMSKMLLQTAKGQRRDAHLVV